jgi:hypothetical protein
VFDQNQLINNQKYIFDHFADCNISHFGINVLAFVFCIEEYYGSQYFSYELVYPHNALITQCTRPKLFQATIGTDFQDGAESMLQLLLMLMAANTSFGDVSNQLPFR